jgi:hypothetical protein
MSQRKHTPGARYATKQGRGHTRLSPKRKAPCSKDLRVRTPGEELWCRRRKASLTGPEAATRLGIGRTLLWLAEKDLASVDGARGLAGPPGLPQLLALARRRQGWGLLSTAQWVGVSHTTLLAWEKAGDRRLQKDWERKGFTFVRPWVN